jgi:hypothetical protein
MLQDLRSLFLLLTIGGAVLGYMYGTSLRQYDAEIALPIDPISYRAAEVRLNSIEELRRFATLKGKLDSPEHKTLESWLIQPFGSIKIEASPRVRKRDWRDIPDAVVADAIPKRDAPQAQSAGGRQMDDAAPVAQGGRQQGDAFPVTQDWRRSFTGGRLMDVFVTASSPIADVASRQAQFSIDYFRHHLELIALRDLFRRWGAEGRMEGAKATGELGLDAAQLQAIDIKLTEMRDLAQRFAKNLPADAQIAANVQMQFRNNNMTILAPSHQAMALEAERINITASMRAGRQQVTYLNYLIALADEFSGKLDAGQAPARLMLELRQRIAAMQPATATPLDHVTHDRAKNAVDFALRDIEARVMAVPTDPEAPRVRIAGVRRSLLALVGAFLGALIWVGFTFRRRIAAAFQQILAMR